jgi:hypothetical protein
LIWNCHPDLPVTGHTAILPSRSSRIPVQFYGRSDSIPNPADISYHIDLPGKRNN